jgi:hypothetical protein
MAGQERQRRARRKTLRALLALADDFRQRFAFEPGDEHTAAALQDYVQQRALLLEHLQNADDAPPDDDERALLAELQRRDLDLQQTLAAHRDALRDALRHNRKQRRALQGYRQPTSPGAQTLALKG